MPRSSKATRREWIGLAVIALPCLLYSMDLTVLTLAGGLPEQLRLELLHAARAAFVHAFRLAAVVSAAIALLMAPVAGILLRPEP
jgi:hypothetical protein